MFKRTRHRKIEQILRAFNGPLLEKIGCYFAGGTAIALALDEYRESIDIDFLCSSPEGFRDLRSLVDNTINPLLTTPLKHAREVRTDAYKILTVLELDEFKVKIEIVREARIHLNGAMDSRLGVPILCKSDLYAEKLLANADRGLDKETKSRDIIDLAMMIDQWGCVPQAAWDKASQAYGETTIDRAFQQAAFLITDKKYLAGCLYSMEMSSDLLQKIQSTIERAASNLPMNSESDRQRKDKALLLSLPGFSSKADFSTIFRKHAETSKENAQVNWAKAENETIEAK